MPELELAVRGGTAVLADGATRVDVGVADGRIVAVEPELGDAAEELDAAGLHVLPGGVDPHVHLDEPGRTGWEGSHREPVRSRPAASRRTSTCR